jgi:hypothetical protein
MDDATLGRRDKAQRLAPGNSVMDDWVRKIISLRRISLRRQEEARRHSLPAGRECKKWAAAFGKQWKILFVQAFFSAKNANACIDECGGGRQAL